MDSLSAGIIGFLIAMIIIMILPIDSASKELCGDILMVTVISFMDLTLTREKAGRAWASEEKASKAREPALDVSRSILYPPLH